jgi:hypothetical protein
MIAGVWSGVFWFCSLCRLIRESWEKGVDSCSPGETVILGLE